MIEEVPPFWWRKAGWQAWLLWPVSLVVGKIAAGRLRALRREAVDMPVLCVAALAIGAAGRTEVAMAIATAAKRAGRRPGLIVAGRSGAFAAPHHVDLHHDLARHVGDEALQLARVAPTVVSGDRVAAARALSAKGCDFAIIADGQVGEKLLADRTLLVADAARGVGNGHVVPAGPVRAPLVDQFRVVDAVLKLASGDGADGVVRLAARAGRPVYDAELRPAGAHLERLRLLAFTGTNVPAQFFDMVREEGGWIEVTRTFADGHLYADDELQEMSATAAASGLRIVTTAYDAFRLRHGSPVAEAFSDQLIVVETAVAFELANVPEVIVSDTLEEWRRRQLG